jgi:hypothetical protein
VPHSAETDSAPSRSDGNSAKPMIPQKCEKIGRFASPRAATRLSHVILDSGFSVFFCASELKL